MPSSPPPPLAAQTEKNINVTERMAQAVPITNFTSASPLFERAGGAGPLCQ